MALPLLVTPEFTTAIPSTGKEIRYRPFLVKEEKILLMAMEGKDQKEISNAVMKLLENCIVSKDVQVTKLTTFDIEYLFLKLRGKSVGEVVELNLGHMNNNKCEEKTPIQLNLDEIKVTGKISDGKIMITKDVGVKMRYPSLKDIIGTDLEDDESGYNLVQKCVEYVFDKDEVYSDFSEKEMKDWIESLGQEQFKKMADFLQKMPKLSHKVKWKCKACGEEESLTLEGLQSFFI